MVAVSELQGMQKTLASLRIGGDIPGLTMDTVVDNYVETEFKDTLDGITDPEERQKTKNRFVEHYITGPGKQFVEDTIQQLKYFYKQAYDGLQSLQSSIAKVTASNAIPAVITVGSASSTPNPAYTAIDNSQKKHSLMAILKSITDFLQKLFAYAILIDFVLPQEVQVLVTTLATVTSLINAIPG